jgi:hypothetical protein
MALDPLKLTPAHTTRYRRSPGDSRRCASRARASAALAPWRATIARDRHPARRIRSKFGAALGEPLVGEGVAELVGVQASQAGLPAAAFQHADQAPRRQPAPQPEP